MSRNKIAIRHGYENTLTACARLAAFATCRPTESIDRLISDRQTMLAVNDLVAFAINARRLMDSVDMLAEFVNVMVPVVTRDEPLADNDLVVTSLAITRIINIIVHHRELEIVRFKSELITWGEDMTVVDVYKRHVEAGNAFFSPMMSVQSDRGGRVILKLSSLVEIFERDVLLPIVDNCSEDGLYLSDTPD